MPVTIADEIIIRLFILLGIGYFALGIISEIKWWNGSDENGNPK